MPITQYKLYKNPDGSSQAPPYIKDGGYYYNPDDHSMFGWYDYDNEFDVPSDLREFTKSRITEIVLSRFVEGELDEQGNLITEQTVIDQVSSWYDLLFTNNFVDKPSPTMNELVYLQERKIYDAFLFMKEKLNEAVVMVPIASANTSCPFGADQETQDNIIGINTAIARGISIPNPTNWSPKGYPIPVEVTHSELAAIGGSILAKKNEYYAIYFLHKATILMTSDYEDVAKYDFSTGYE